jgi:hypothetical protein
LPGPQSSKDFDDFTTSACGIIVASSPRVDWLSPISGVAQDLTNGVADMIFSFQVSSKVSAMSFCLRLKQKSLIWFYAS